MMLGAKNVRSLRTNDDRSRSPDTRNSAEGRNDASYGAKRMCPPYRVQVYVDRITEYSFNWKKKKMQKMASAFHNTFAIVIF